MSSFRLANNYTTHLVVQPADLRLNPPESYLIVQDALIVSCGVLYALCYLFYMTRTYKDKRCAGPIEYTCGTMAYEVFYAFTTTSTTFERLSFLVWFLLDFAFASVVLRSVYAPGQRPRVVARMLVVFAALVALLRVLTLIWPDEREQLTAYWTGIALQFPIGWGSLYLLLRDGHTKGHSLEIWITRYLGCFTAYGVFIWRYLNVPQNWAYVASRWSVWIIVLTLLPETVYPFVYLWVHKTQKRKVA